MSDRVGLYLSDLHPTKWGVRCLDCTTAHNRAGLCPVKLPKSVTVNFQTDRPADWLKPPGSSTMHQRCPRSRSARRSRIRSANLSPRRRVRLAALNHLEQSLAQNEAVGRLLAHFARLCTTNLRKTHASAAVSPTVWFVGATIYFHCI